MTFNKSSLKQQAVPVRVRLQKQRQLVNINCTEEKKGFIEFIPDENDLECIALLGQTNQAV